MAEKKKEIKAPQRKPAVKRRAAAKPVAVKQTDIKPVASTPVTEKAQVSNKLPGILDLFQSSWTLFKSTFFSYFKLLLLGIGSLLAGIVITVLLTLPLMFVSGGSASDLFNAPTALEIILIAIVVIWLLVFFIGIIAYSVLLPILYVLILHSSKKLSLDELFKEAKPYFVPYFIVGLLTGLLILGGFGLLIVPGLLFSLFFVFITYTILLEKLTGTAAIKRSYALVKNNFWEILLRVVVLQVLITIGSNIISSFGNESKPDIFVLISMLFSLVIEWFAAAYMYLLYRQVKDRKQVDANISITWMWIVAAVGFAIIVLVIAGAIASNVWMIDSADPLNLMDLSSPGESI